MKLFTLVILGIVSLNSFAQTNDTIAVYNHHCESLNPYEIDTTYFWYNSDTLYIRNIHKSFCSPTELKATIKTENDTIKIIVFNPTGIDCLADCSYGYTIKLPLIQFETLNIKIFNENFKVIMSELKTNIEFPAPGAKWNQATLDLESIGFYDAERFEIKNDTLINSINYRRLFTTWRSSFYRTGPCEVDFITEPYPVNTYLGAIRKNEKEQVIFIPNLDSTEFIIYDFSLLQSDTIKWARPSGLEEFKAVVSSIDSVLVEEDYRRVIKLSVSGNLPDEWIEGIGSTSGILATFYPRPWEKKEQLLLCYRDNNISELNFYATECSWCDIITNIQKPSISQRIIIKPNPVNEQLNISYNNIIPSTLKIYDQLGRLVYLKEIFGTGEIIINRHELKKGIVNLIIHNERGLLIQKKIIII